MPLYTSAAAAIALGVPPKWLDNLLSHNEIYGVDSTSQGVQRRLATSTIEIVAVTRDLANLGIPIARAVTMATSLVTGAHGQLAAGETVVISVDRAAVQSNVSTRLAHAVEVAPNRRRGRPPANPAKSSGAPFRAPR